jgi:hypothetical protein
VNEPIEGTNKGQAIIKNIEFAGNSTVFIILSKHHLIFDKKQHTTILSGGML